MLTMEFLNMNWYWLIDILNLKYMEAIKHITTQIKF